MNPSVKATNAKLKQGVPWGRFQSQRTVCANERTGTENNTAQLTNATKRGKLAGVDVEEENWGIIN